MKLQAIKWHSDLSYDKQIELQIKKLIVSGRLKQGEQLPPCFILAQQLKLSKLTIHSAYKNLVESGIVSCVNNEYYVK